LISKTPQKVAEGLYQIAGLDHDGYTLSTKVARH
jgi:hypothetical protein